MNFTRLVYLQLLFFRSKLKAAAADVGFTTKDGILLLDYL